MKTYQFVSFGLAIVALLLYSCAAPQTASTPAKWEYKVEPICAELPTLEFVELLSKDVDEWFNYEGTCIASEKVGTRLNELGAEGWELVAIHSPLAGYGTGFPYSNGFSGAPNDLGRLVLKRPVR